MTIRKALIFYLSMVMLLVVAAWALALLYDWQSGMVLMTVVLIEHVWRVVKRIRQSKP